ncbi:MAG: hypothetical protein M1609_13565 [Firmicutes bacterium]|nr:hypothetical protein [Bacillota bacterium]
MANWVIRGLATGVVTTRYPFNTEHVPGSLSIAPVMAGKRCLPDCNECIKVCYTGAIKKSLLSTGAFEIDYARCVFCLRCIEVCPGKVICAEKKIELAITRNSWAGNSVKTVKENKVGRYFRRSLHIRHVDAGACEACLSEINALSNPYYDLHRLGFFFVNSPRHADALLVSGSVTENMKEALVKTYQAMPGPKLVIATGACAAGGWLAGQNYACSRKLDSILQVNISIPGCPPSPLTLLHGLLLAVGREPKINLQG